MITEEELLRKAAFEMLLKTVENLKCCGNCKLHLESCPKEWNPSDENTELIPSCGYCDQWQSDNLTRKEREE